MPSDATTTAGTTTGATSAPANGIHVEIAPERLGSFLGIPLTNTLLTSWGVIIVLIIVAVLIGTRLKMIPGRFQLLFESLVSFIYDYVAETLESRELARKYFPFIATIFLFIFASNLLEFTPGIGSVGFYMADGFIPLFRSVNTDLNVTLMLAVISFLVIEFSGIAIIGGWKYAGKFVNFRGHSISERLINFAVGLIELFSELGRLISFSFRLFGNIFAGEVLILVVTYFIPYAGPVPVMSFEIFVGFVQAAIFALLTLFFIKLAIMEAH